MNTTITQARQLAVFSVLAAIASQACHGVPAVRPPQLSQATASAAHHAPSTPPTNASQSLVLAPVSELAALDLEARFGGYAARDAVWADQLPVLVNRAFDFHLALALEGAGAGMAVVNRRKGNAELARQLAAATTIDPQDIARAFCNRRAGGCPRLNAERARAYAFLFGERAARLRVVLEPVREAGVLLYAAISASYPAQDFAQASMLREVFEAELRHAIDAFEASAPARSEAPGRCDAGDGLHVEGTIITRDGEHVLLAALTPDAFVRCPAEAFSELPPGSPPR